jgi:UDP-GlcNAc:undecaprenyl-phosphate/decaprenyl-phosphate GlcNAc-1-phosphate transferase
VALVLLCAILGFLVFNVRHRWQTRAAVFLGDAGSTMLGAAIAYLILTGLDAPGLQGSIVALAWVAAVPAIDTTSLIVRRILSKMNPLVGDRRHIHHLLVDSGVPHGRATSLIVLATFATGGFGILGTRLGLSDSVMVAALLVPAAMHTVVVLVAEMLLKRRGSAGAGAEHLGAQQ